MTRPSGDDAEPRAVSQPADEPPRPSWAAPPEEPPSRWRWLGRVGSWIRERQLLVFLSCTAAVMVVSELAFSAVQDFWQARPVTATFATELVILAFAYLVIEELLDRRDGRRWARVAYEAVHNFEMGAQVLMGSILEPSREAVRALSDAEAAKRATLETWEEQQADDVIRAFFGNELDQRHRDVFERWYERTGSAMDDLHEQVRSWAPSMLTQGELAQLLNEVSGFYRVSRQARSRIAGRMAGNRLTDDGYKDLVKQLVRTQKNYSDLMLQLRRAKTASLQMMLAQKRRLSLRRRRHRTRPSSSG